MKIAHEKFRLSSRSTIKVEDRGGVNICTLAAPSESNVFVVGSEDRWLESWDEDQITVQGVFSVRVRNSANKTVLSLKLRNGSVVMERR